MKKKFLIFAFLTSFFLSSKGVIALEIIISSCTTLDQAGATYYLNQSIWDSNVSICMDITANNITLDCQGYTIDGDDYLARIAIWIYRSSPENTNITIKNCIISDYGDGVYLYNANNNTIANTTSKSNRGYDLEIGYYGYGIHLYNSSDNRVINCMANSNHDDGIYLEDSSGNEIVNCTANSNHDDGIYLYNSPNNEIVNCTANSNCYGIHLYNSPNNEIVNCTANSNHDGIYLAASSDNRVINCMANSNCYGIRLGGSSGNEIVNCTAKENTEFDLGVGIISNSHCNNYIENLIGSNDLPIKYFNYSIILQDEVLSELILCNANYSLIENVTIDASQTLTNNGILLYRTSYTNLTNINSSFNRYGVFLHHSHENRIHSSIFQQDYYGIYFYYSSNNSVYNNLFNNTGIYVHDSPNYWNVTLQPGKRIYSPGTHIGGNYWTNSTGNGYSDICNDTDKDGFCDNPYSIASNNTDYLPLSDEYTWILITLNSPRRVSERIISPPSKNILVYGYAFYKNLTTAVPYSNKQINFTYDGKILGSNTTNSSGFYTFTFSIDYEGLYNLSANAQDGKMWGRNSTLLLVSHAPSTVKYLLSYHLGDSKTDDVYRIGDYNESIDNLNLTRTLYSTQLAHAYVCSYDKTEYTHGLLLSFIHSYEKTNLNFLNFSTSALTTSYTLELSQRMDSSSLILAFTKGDCDLIENKMYLVETQAIPSRAFSSFAFEAPLQNIFEIIAAYDRIELEGNLTFSRGTHNLCIEKSRISDAHRPVIEVRKC